MKRIGFLLATAMAFVLVMALPAFAGSELGNRPGGPGVSGAGGTAGGTAFTGSNVSTIFAYLVALVVVGALAAYMGRRRTLTTS